MPTRYIGITDYTSFAQVQMMGELHLKLRRGTDSPNIHIGVMMSQKTLNGLETSWTNAFPPKERISSIFRLPWMFNCLHYADYKAIDFAQNLERALGYGGEHMNALQLDMVWPDPEDLTVALLQAGREDDLEIVLQINSDAMELEGDSPVRVAERIKRQYEGIITHVLLDESGGKGRAMKPENLIPFVEEIYERLPTIGMAAAGGLGPETDHLMQPLLDRFPLISCDAQGRLRPSHDAHDPIDWDMAKTYHTKTLARMDV